MTRIVKSGAESTPVEERHKMFEFESQMVSELLDAATFAVPEIRYVPNAEPEKRSMMLPVLGTFLGFATFCITGLDP